MTGDEARTVRRGLRLSARQLAEILGTTESSIYRWELRHERAVPLMFEHALLHVVSLSASNGGRRAALS
jgi:DNA-binding transcriptional regulator YiaG